MRMLKWGNSNIKTLRMPYPHNWPTKQGVYQVSTCAEWGWSDLGWCLLTLGASSCILTLGVLNPHFLQMRIVEWGCLIPQILKVRKNRWDLTRTSGVLLPQFLTVRQALNMQVILSESLNPHFLTVRILKYWFLKYRLPKMRMVLNPHFLNLWSPFHKHIEVQILANRLYPNISSTVRLHHSLHRKKSRHLATEWKLRIVSNTLLRMRLLT